MSGVVKRMPRWLGKIALAAAVGFIVPFVALSAVTHFVLLPSLTLCSLAVLSAIAAYVPRNGVPLAVALLVLGGVFAVSLFLISPAFSAVPQPGGSMLVPLGATAAAFVWLMIYGARRRRAAEFASPER